MTRERTRGIWLLLLVGIIAVILTAGLMSLQPYGTPLGWLVRGTALLGYEAILLAIVSSAYMKQMSRIFGRPFIKVHHVLSVAGLILITLHPIGVAIDAASVRVFLPRFDSLATFFQLGGRLAWYLLGAASLAAALRRGIGQTWRAIHFLNYVAFFLGTIHAVMIGTDLQSALAKAISIVLILVVVAVPVQKQLAKRRRRGASGKKT